MAFFNARFHKFGIFEKRLALKILEFIYCLALSFEISYLLFGIELLRFIYCLAFSRRKFGIFDSPKPGITAVESSEALWEWKKDSLLRLRLGLGRHCGRRRRQRV